MAPLRIPAHPLPMLRFGMRAAFSREPARAALFRDARARALFAGCAAHSILPLTPPLTAALGLMFAITGHVVDWPVAEGGSRAIAQRARVLPAEPRRARSRPAAGSSAARPAAGARRALRHLARSSCRASPATRLPAGYRRRLGRYRYGPGVFKLDWALDGPIPWRDPACREASTVHVGGTLEEICASERDMYRGRHSERPFLILCQQSEFDATRAPAGRHTGYAYCHVPHGSTVDMTDAIERQVERFAPGFRDRILARHAMSTGGLRALQPELSRRRDHRRRRRRAPALEPAGHATRPLLDAESAALHLLGGDAARRRRPRHVRALDAAQSARRRIDQSPVAALR